MSERDEKIKAISDRLEAGVKEVFSSEKYRDYLTAMSKFYHYSSRNTLLIYMQNPNASHVASFSAWKTMGRSVNKNEKGIEILAPAPYKVTEIVTRDEHGNQLPEPQKREVIKKAFRPAYIFDVSQTKGKELPKLIKQLSGQVAEYDKLMSSLQEIAPCPIQFEAMEGKNGFYNRTENRIAVKEGMSEEQTVKTTIHELAHARLGHGDNPDMDRQTGEVQAESVAYVVCQHFGIDSSQYSFGYVASWSDGKDSSTLKDCLETIRTAAKEVIEDTQRAMSKERTLEREVAPEQEKTAPEKAEPEKKAAPQKSSKRGVAAKLEAAKQEVAARDAAPRAPQKEQTKIRSVGHDR